MAKTRSEVLSALLSADSVLVITHGKPDGDALGSAFGTRQFLRDNGKKADVLLTEPPPSRYTKLCTEYVGDDVDIDDYSMVLLLDCAVRDRLGTQKPIEKLLEHRCFWNIDHHYLNTDINAANSHVVESSSTCEIMTDILLDKPGNAITPDTAGFLLLGMMTDTGGFRFSNTKGKTLRTAAMLLDAGADMEKIANAIYFSKPLGQLELESDIVASRMKLEFDGRFAYACLDNELLAKHDFSMKEDEGLIDLLRSVDGVIIAMLVYERGGGYRVSLRSKDSKFPVFPIARHFGGGGHAQAAGAIIKSDIKDIIPQVLTLVEKTLNGEKVP
ncbi:MAG: DHH family phosphoesterase [Victivallaceae bacterium]|nr:DHH family phosphoesterase [Victivallaceae bacterium]